MYTYTHTQTYTLTDGGIKACQEKKARWKLIDRMSE